MSQALSIPLQRPVPEEQKSNRTFIFLGMLALAFSYLIAKDVRMPMPIVVSLSLLCGGLLFMIGISKPHVIAYVLVAYLPFSKILAGDFNGLAVAFNFTNLLMGFVLIAWFAGTFSKGESLWIGTSLNKPIFCFVLIGCLSLFRGTYFSYSGYMWPAFVELKRWLTPIFMYFLFLNTVKDRVMIKNIVYIMMITTTIVGLMAIYDYINVGTVGNMDKARIGGIADQPNMLAAFFNYYMFLPFAFFLSNPAKFRNWLLLIPVAICFRGIMVTFSRGGYLAFAFGLLAILFFNKKKKWFILAIVGFVLCILNPNLMPPGIRYRMAQTINADAGSYMSSMSEISEDSLEMSARTRVEIWKGAVKMIAEHPVLGVGYGLFNDLIPFYWSGEKKIDAHNTYLIIAAEMGIPALLIFIWIVLESLRQTLLLYKRSADPFDHAVALGFLAGLFGMLMSNMFGSRLDSQEISAYFWILSALVMRLRIINEREGTWMAPVRRKLDA